jgi:hypothetical protein
MNGVTLVDVALHTSVAYLQPATVVYVIVDVPALRPSDVGSDVASVNKPHAVLHAATTNRHSLIIHYRILTRIGQRRILTTIDGRIVSYNWR